MDNTMNIHQAIRTECVVGDARVTTIPELQCFLGKRIELIALDLEATQEGSSLSPAIKDSGQSKTVYGSLIGLL